MGLSRRDCFRLGVGVLSAVAVPFSALAPRPWEPSSFLSLMRDKFNAASSGVKTPEAMLLGEQAFIEYWNAVTPHHWLITAHGEQHFAFRGRPVLCDSSLDKWHLEAMKQWPGEEMS